MNQASSEGEMIKKKDVLLTKDRAYYIAYLITIILPLVVGICFYSLAVRARIYLGHWPVYGDNGGPSSRPDVLVDLIDFITVLISFLGITPSIFCIPTSIVMTIPYTFKKSIFSRKKLAIFILLIIINTVAIAGIATDFGGLWSWFID
jgi:hypothetical protein